ncbi:MAG: Holliday junction branch migration protein RuvA [Myxococcales bacterium]|nr:Holliday junction branch migration protein RuvA [Polyangiaceae bacterium]MDW8248714.1 Holliday junction branch migration protein RuvA [Myxococcales bacterium]
MVTGRIAHEEPDGTLVVDVNGVGYELLAPLGTIGRLRGAGNKGPSEPLTFYVHTHVREDTLQLFGFSSAFERSVFRELLGVSTVGPRTALSILSHIPARELGRVIARKELGRLTSIPNVGKKTAERLLLELRDKLPSTGTTEPCPTPGKAAAPASSGNNRTMLISALTNSGYKLADAEQAVELLGERIDVLPLPELIREALKLLAR